MYIRKDCFRAQTISVWMLLYLVRLRTAWKSLFLFGHANGKLNMAPTGLNLLQYVHLNHGQRIFNHTSNKVWYPLANCKRLQPEENVQRELMTALFNAYAKVVSSSRDPVFVWNWQICHCLFIIIKKINIFIHCFYTKFHHIVLFEFIILVLKIKGKVISEEFSKKFKQQSN